MMRFKNVLNMVAIGALLGLTAIRPGFTDTGDGIYTGTVVSVIDARTLRIAKDGGGEIRIRLLGSDQRDKREATEPSLEGARAGLMPGHRVHIEPVRWEGGILEGHLWLEGGEQGAGRSQTTPETTTTDYDDS